MKVHDVLLPTHITCGLPETKHGEFPQHLPSNDCIKCWVHDQYSGVSVLDKYQEPDLAIVTFVWPINIPKIEKPRLEETRPGLDESRWQIVQGSNLASKRSRP